MHVYRQRVDEPGAVQLTLGASGVAVLERELGGEHEQPGIGGSERMRASTTGEIEGRFTRNDR